MYSGKYSHKLFRLSTSNLRVKTTRCDQFLYYLSPLIITSIMKFQSTLALAVLAGAEHGALRHSRAAAICARIFSRRVIHRHQETQQSSPHEAVELTIDEVIDSL